MPDGLSAARAVGIDLDVSGAQPFHGIRLHRGETSVGAEFPNGPGLGVRRTALHEFLVERAIESGVRLLWGARVSQLAADGVIVDGRIERAGWIAGADGERSHVRRWAGLDAATRDSRRFGFRRHFRLAHGARMPRMMEVHWGESSQLYITPVADREVCVASVARHRLRVGMALGRFPEVARLLRGAEPVGSERGAVTASRRLKRVAHRNVALIGDASGSVDAVTGEGLCVLFQQAAALSEALAAGDLALYQTAHARLMRRPEIMADLLLTMDGRRLWQRFAIGGMARMPWIFRGLLCAHVGQFSR
jgi:2-polyprenyl-6-methoxyphenol hydroxylase-like FAD-dependent oxidoreductase